MRYSKERKEMANNNAVITALLTLNVANFVSNLNKASKSATDAKTNIEKIGNVGKTFTNIGTTLTRNVTLPIVTLGTKAVQTAADFEQSMSKVAAISGATGDDLKKLETAAREWGATTVFSAEESAEAFQYMALAGWDTNQMLEAIGPILYLAGGAMLDLGTTSDIVTDNITAFGLAAEDTARFTDVLAQTMTNSNTDVLQLGEAFKYVAPLAGTLGFSIEDVSLALGLMADNGIKGSQAGTSLRSALTNLVNPTDSMAMAMQTLGIEITNSDGSMKSLREIIDVLRSSMGGMTEAEREAAIEMLALNDNGEIAAQAMKDLSDEEIALALAYDEGTKAIQGWSQEQINSAAASLYSAEELANLTDDEIEYAVAVAAGTTAVEGMTAAEQASTAAQLFGKQALSGLLAIINTSEEDYNNLADAIDNAEGATQDLYEVSQDNLKGTLADLNSSWEELMITIGEKIIPLLVPLVDKLIDVVNWIANLDEGTLSTIITIAGLAAAIGPILLLIGNLITAVTGVIKVVSTVVKVVKLVTAALNPWIIVIGLVVAALIWLWNNCEEFRDIVIAVFDAVVSFVKGVVDGLVEFFTVDIPNAIADMVQWFKDLPGNIMNAIGSLVDKVSEWATNVKDTFVEFATSTVTAVVDFFVELPGKIYDAIITFVQDVVNWGQSVSSTFTDWVTNIITNVVDFFSELPGKIYDAIVDTIARVLVWGLKVTEQARESVTNIITSIVDWFKELPGKIYDAIKGAVDKVREWGTNMLNIAKEVIPNFVSWIVDTIKELPGKIVSVGTDMVTGLWEGIVGAKDWLLGKISGFVSNIVDGFKDFFSIGSPSRVMADEVGTDVTSGVGMGMEDNIDSINKPIENIRSTIIDALDFGGVSSDMAFGAEQAASNSLTTAADSLSKNIASVFSNVTKTMSGMQAVAPQRTGTANESISKVVSGNGAESPINIGSITVRNEDDVKMLSRSLFDRDAAKLRALGGA